MPEESSPNPAVADSSATAEGDGAPRAIRFVGFFGAAGALVTAGLIDGILTYARSPAGSRRISMLFWLFLHCAAAFATVGVAAGLVQELLVQAAARRPALRAFAAFMLDGPRRWFARDDRTAVALAIVLLTALPAWGLLFPISWYVIHGFHSRILMALGIMIAAPALFAVFGIVAIVLAWPLGWIARKAGRFASPGTVAVLALVGGALMLSRFIGLHWPTLKNLDGRGAVAAAGVVVVDLAITGFLGAKFVRRGRVLPWRAVGVTAGVVLVLFLLSGFTLGRRQAVLSTVVQRSYLTRYVIRPLQRVIDLDRDGYGVLFGGGDCNDFNRAIHPGARDVPGNGVDENCTGRDARIAPEEGDGRYGRVPESLASQRPSFVFISIDTVRPDHTSLYGYHRPTTPNLVHFAERAARFTHAYCTSPRSLRSFASIWTGRYPSMISWGVDNQYPPLQDENVTIAETLRDAGYDTAAFTNALYFSYTPGFYQGFGMFREGRTWIKEDHGPMVEAASSWLLAHRGSTRPFFAWIHFMEAHEPYEDVNVPRDFGSSDIDRYDEEIALADRGVGNVLSAIDAMEAAGHPIYVVIFSDHGEGFWEHGLRGHSWDLHDEAVRVVMLARGPGVVPGDRVPLASLFDLFPTVTNLASIPLPRPVPSRSLVPMLFEPNAPATRRDWRRELYLEVTPDGVMPAEAKGLIQPPFALIHDLQRNSWELYDHRNDPREARNIFDDEPETASRLRAQLLDWIESSGSAANRTADVIDAHRLARPPAQMQRPIGVRFGNVVELLGYDMARRSLRRGDSIEFSAYLRVLSRTTEPMWITVYFAHPNGGPMPWFITHYPILGRYLTTQWNPGEILVDPMSLRIGDNMEAGPYRMFFCIEHAVGGPRVAPNRGSNPWSLVDIGEFEILP